VSELPNHRAGVDAGFAFLFAFGSHWPGTTQHGRSAGSSATLQT
jgi:hypothetical protein